MVVKKAKSATKKRAEITRGRPSGFAQSLLREWRRLQLPATDVVVGVSGGADSVALLLALDELIKAKKLKFKIFVAHVDHRLRKTASAADARWVKELAKRLGHDVSIVRSDVKSLAKQNRDNLEQAARRARYKAFASIAQKRSAGIVLTAHTMDDQAETVLLNLLRGSGSDGLGGIERVRPLDETGRTLLVRPLLSWARRKETEQFCLERGVEFRHDEMNQDERFARVRVRRQMLPLMESFNPRVVEALGRTAELLRDDSDALESAAKRLLELSIAEGVIEGIELRTDLLASARPALRRRTLRLWLGQRRGDLRRLELVHIRAVENLLVGNRGGRTVELPGGSTVSRRRGLLAFKGSPATPTGRGSDKTAGPRTSTAGKS
jgi:tRNA(Ile)-lysidine synthase